MCISSHSWAKQDCLKTMEHISYGIFNNCYGSYIFDNQDKYVGEWKNDKPHGQGTYTYSNGKIEEGTWKEGLLVKAQTIQKTENTYKEYIMMCPVLDSFETYKLVDNGSSKKTYVRSRSEWQDWCNGGPYDEINQKDEGAICVLKIKTTSGKWIYHISELDFYTKTYSQQLDFKNPVGVKCKSIN
jgi:hypothetical protein